MAPHSASQSSPAAGFDAERYRADFPLLAQEHPSGRPLAYLDNASTTPRPRSVIEALVACEERAYANVHRGIHWLSELATEHYEGARARVAAWLGAATPAEVIFTRGTTEGLNLVARSWGDVRIKPGDELVLSLLEHHSNIVPWQQLAARRGAVVRWIGLTPEGQLDLEALDRLLGPRTRLVAVTAASNVLGTLVPVAEITRRAHAVGAIVVVDAAQSAPHQPLDVRAWDADFVAWSGHKLLGPSGIGVLWGREALLAEMPPFQGGGSMIRRVTQEGFEPAEIPARFEAGTPAIVPAIALPAALDYLDAVGREAIAAHERHLTERAHAVMGAIPGVRMLGPPPTEKTGIVSFVIEGIHAHDVAQLVDDEGIAIRAGHHCAMPLHRHLGIPASSRASFYLYNTRDEVDRLGRAVERVRHVLRRGR